MVTNDGRLYCADCGCRHDLTGCGKPGCVHCYENIKGATSLEIDYARESELDDVLHRLTNAVTQGGLYCQECGDEDEGLPHGDRCVRFVLDLVNEVVGLGLAPVAPVHKGDDCPTEESFWENINDAGIACNCQTCVRWHQCVDIQVDCEYCQEQEA